MNDYYAKELRNHLAKFFLKYEPIKVDHNDWIKNNPHLIECLTDYLFHHPMDDAAGKDLKRVKKVFDETFELIEEHERKMLKLNQ